MPRRRVQLGQILVNPRFDEMSRYLIVRYWERGKFDEVPWIEHPKGAYYLAALNKAKSLGFDDVEEVGSYTKDKNAIIFQPIHFNKIEPAGKDSS